jgi:Derlin-2/3
MGHPDSNLDHEWLSGCTITGMGILAAHLYDFLTRLYPTFQGGRNWLQTPSMIKRAFGADRSSFSHKAYGSSFRPGRPIPEPSSSGWTSALTGSWGGRAKEGG